jgi:hypothetical protein
MPEDRRYAGEGQSARLVIRRAIRHVYIQRAVSAAPDEGDDMRAFVRAVIAAAAAGLFLALAAGAASAAGPRPAAQVPARSGTVQIMALDGVPDPGSFHRPGYFLPPPTQTGLGGQVTG